MTVSKAKAKKSKVTRTSKYLTFLSTIRKHPLISLSVLLACLIALVIGLNAYKEYKESKLFPQLSQDFREVLPDFQSRDDSGWKYDQNCKPIAPYGAQYGCEVNLINDSVDYKSDQYEELNKYIDVLNDSGLFTAKYKSENNPGVYSFIPVDVVWHENRAVDCALSSYRETATDHTIIFSCGSDAVKNYY